MQPANKCQKTDQSSCFEYYRIENIAQKVTKTNTQKLPIEVEPIQTPTTSLVVLVKC